MCLTLYLELRVAMMCLTLYLELRVAMDVQWQWMCL